MELIYNEKTETWEKAPEYSITVYFDTEEDRDRFITDMKAMNHGKRDHNSQQVEP